MIIEYWILNINTVFSSPSKIFFYACFAFIVGIGGAAFLFEGFLGDGFVVFLFALAFLVLSYYLYPAGNFLAALLLAAMLLGVWRYGLALVDGGGGKVRDYNGQAVSLEGVVVSEPEKKDGYSRIEVEARRLADGVPLAGRFLANVPLFPEFAYGDVVAAGCALEAPEKIEDFAYDRYLARYGVFSLCKQARVAKIGEASGAYFSFQRGLIAFKGSIREKINRQLGGKEAGLALATLLADKNVISGRMKDDFSRSGLTHIIAVSGTHIAIFAGVMMESLIFLGLWRRQAFWLSTILLAIYIVMVGAPASALRAGVMGFLFLYALSIGRLGKLHIALTFAAAVLLLFNPRLLRDDIGFQLSFLAILGSGLFYEKWRDRMAEWKLFENKPGWLSGIANVFLMTLTAQVFTAPIIAYNFGTVSLIAPVANVLALWIVPFIFVSLLVGLSLSFVVPPLSFFFFLPAKLVLLYLIKVAEYCALLPWASVQL